MKIGTRVRIGGLLTVSVILAYGGMALHVDRAMSQLVQEIKEANEIVNKITLLRNLTLDYLLYRSEPAQGRWLVVYEKVLLLLDNSKNEVLKKDYHFLDARQKLQLLGDTFARLMSVQSAMAIGQVEGQKTKELQNRLTAQLLQDTKNLLTLFFDLTETMNDKLVAMERFNILLDSLALSALVILLISNAIFLQRSVVRPVLRLHAGAEIIGAGNLDYRVGNSSRNEIGELSRAFDQMTANLRQVTVSRDELLREMGERQRVEEALRESEARLRLAQDAAKAGTWEWDLQTNRNYWSDELWKLYGLEPYSCDPSYEAWRQTIHPDDRAATEHHVQEAARQGTELNAQWRVLDPDGGERWLMSRGLPRRDVDGKPTGYIGIVMDITERKRAEEALKKSEERLRQAAQAGRMFAFEWDPVTDEVIRSEEAGPILGLEGSAATHGTGQGFFAKILAEDREKVIQRLQQLTPETDRYTANYRIVRSDTGEIIWLEEIAMAAFEGGRLRRLYGMMMDITERKRAEEALRQRSAQLAEAVAALEGKNAEMERFTYTISHDLKSPLVTISTFLSYLEEDLRRGDTGRITQDMQYMRTATDKMSQMLGELLELSRLGRIANPPKEISFQELVQEALQAVAGAVAARGVEVWVTEKDVMLLGDRHRLGAIWQNLLENAVKYMGGQPRPRLEIGLEEPGEEVVFFVRDNGIGIESGYQEKIFNLFEKLDSQSGGTGIGLAVAKRIVELYRGKIWVESGGTDQGACFRFTLPGALIARGEGSGSGEGNRYDT